MSGGPGAIGDLPVEDANLTGQVEFFGVSQVRLHVEHSAAGVAGLEDLAKEGDLTHADIVAAGETAPRCPVAKVAIIRGMELGPAIARMRLLAAANEGLHSELAASLLARLGPIDSAAVERQAWAAISSVTASTARLGGRNTRLKEAPVLVLSRHRDESIIIGDDIVLTIVDIRGDKVRIGIDAPQSVPVHRREVYDAIKREEAKRAAPGELD